MSVFDVAIVGAGPAGSLAALRLARGGARVVLLDGSHPREKPCGGGVTARALDLVADVPGVETLRTVTVRTLRFVEADARRSIAVPLDPSSSASADPNPRSSSPGGVASHSGRGRSLVVVERREFDGWLYAAAAEAGAEIVRTRVTGVDADAGGATIVTAGGRLRARFTIGADGAASLVRRWLARPFGRREVSVATGFFAHGATSEEIALELVADPPGYLWSFPRPQHLAIGICAQADATRGSAALRARAASWIDRARLAARATLQPYSWPIPSLTAGALRELQLAGNRWCLVGDAAGLVDPITREGIFFALQSAEYVSGALLSAADDPASAYARRVRRAIVPELALAARLKAGFFRPRFARLLLDALAQSDAVRGVMADLAAGRQPYATLKRRLLRTFEWRLAWEFVRMSRGRARAAGPAR